MWSQLCQMPERFILNENSSIFADCERFLSMSGIKLYKKTQLVVKLRLNSGSSMFTMFTLNVYKPCMASRCLVSLSPSSV